MKKLSVLGLLTALSLFIITACASPAPTAPTAPALQDGSYKVTYDKPDARDWTAYLTFDVADGKITNVDFDYLGSGPNEGKKKTEDPAYNEAMLNTAGTNPATYAPIFEESFQETQDPEQIEAVSGATTSFESIKHFAAEGIKAAQSGTPEVILPQP